MLLKVTRLVADARLPSRAYAGDLGIDLFSAEDCEIPPSGQAAISTGIAVEMPQGWGGLLKDRSSLALKRLYLSAGVIDNGYRGEIKVLLRNESPEPYKISAGAKIAQMIPVPVTDWRIEEAGELRDSERNAQGFGSSGG